MSAAGDDMLRVRVIEEANAAELPPPELSDQLWEKLAARLGEPVLDLARYELPTHAAHGVTAALVARKWLVSALACTVVAGAGVALWAHSRPHRPGVVAAAPTAQPTAAPAVQATRPPSTPIPVEPREVDDLSEETRLLGEAQRALSRGAPEQSLRWLSEHAARFPTGVLAHERDAARVFALCALGRPSEARKERQRFIRTWPDSPLGALVRARCVDPHRAHAIEGLRLDH